MDGKWGWVDYSLPFEITMQRAMGNSKENVFVEHYGDQQGLHQCIIGVGEKAILTIMKESIIKVL